MNAEALYSLFRITFSVLIICLAVVAIRWSIIKEKHSHKNPGSLPLDIETGQDKSEHPETL